MTLYFAYGSNLCPKQMWERCPDVRFKCVAVLEGYRLAFSRTSKGRGCGVADVVPDEGKQVWGVVYEVTEDDLPCLDRNEGYRPDRPEGQNAYVRRRCSVRPREDSEAALEAWCYFANPQPGNHVPSEDYMRTIIRGARFWSLPPSYIRELEEVQTAP